MKLLYIGDSFRGDDSFVQALSRLPALTGHSLATSFLPRDTATEIAILAQSKGFNGIICSQQKLLEAALRQLPDFVPPSGNRKASIDDYAGSWIDLPRGIPMVVINHLDRLVSVPSEKFVTNRFISKLTKPEKWFPQTEFKWKQVTEDNQDECMRTIESSELLAIDIETTSDTDRSITCVGYATWPAGICYVLHFNSEWAWHFVKRANKCKAGKIFQNGQYDNTYFARWNCLPDNYLYDTLNLFHCWYSELPKRLDFITAFALRKQRYWKHEGRTGSLEDLFRYNALDCWATLNSFLSLIAEVPKWAVDNYLQEFPLVFPAINAALEGVKVDTVQFAKVRKQKEEEAEAALERVRFWLNEPNFNPRSPQQMTALFKLLGCGSLPDTAAASMLKARAASPLNDLILGGCVEYKKAAKLISSYLDPEILWNGRWMYSIDPAGTDTGRAASKESAFWCGNSIQTVPRGDSIKSTLCADSGWLLGECDKAQSEARCVGYLSGEEKLIELVESPHDYHSWNASAFFGVPYEQIYDEELGVVLDKILRDLSKRTNHGANYNMGAAVMLDTMGPKLVAKAKMALKLPARWSLLQVCDFLLQRYSETYPRVKGPYYDAIILEIERTNRLVSPFGWTRYFFAKPTRQAKTALNAAVAHPSQNLSVAIINKEWYAIWRETVYGSLRDRVRIKAQIHDSILFQYRAEDKSAAEEVKARMQTAVEVKGVDGIRRTMRIPGELKHGAERWSEL